MFVKNKERFVSYLFNSVSIVKSPIFLLIKFMTQISIYFELNIVMHNFVYKVYLVVDSIPKIKFP